MLDRPAAKTAAVAAVLSLGSAAFARRYPQSRLLIALPLLQAGLQVVKAKQRATQVRRLRHDGAQGLIERVREAL